MTSSQSPRKLVIRLPVLMPSVWGRYGHTFNIKASAIRVALYRADINHVTPRQTLSLPGLWESASRRECTGHKRGPAPPRRIAKIHFCNLPAGQHLTHRAGLQHGASVSSSMPLRMTRVLPGQAQQDRRRGAAAVPWHLHDQARHTGY